MLKKMALYTEIIAKIKIYINNIINAKIMFVKQQQL
jgi:hypothetical protein